MRERVVVATTYTAMLIGACIVGRALQSLIAPYIGSWPAVLVCTVAGCMIGYAAGTWVTNKGSGG